jgi:hypothetical protein
MKSPFPLKSPAQHQTPVSDSGNLVKDVDISSRKLSVESDSDKSTSSIPELSKETCVQEAWEFVEKLKMNEAAQKESTSGLATTVQSLSDKTRPAKQTDEGYVSAELAPTEQGNDFAKLPQESPSLPESRLPSSGTKEQQQQQQVHSHQQQPYDMLHMYQQQSAYHQEYNQNVSDPRWQQLQQQQQHHQQQQQQQQQMHHNDETQNRQRDLFMTYYAEMQRKMSQPNNPYSGQAAGGLQDPYGMHQHLKQFYPGTDSGQAANYEMLLYQQQYAQYMHQLQYSGSATSSKELLQLMAAMNKFPQQSQQPSSQQHHQSTSQQQYSKAMEDSFKGHKANLGHHHQQPHQHLQQQQQHHAHPVNQSRTSPSSHAAHDEYSEIHRHSAAKVQNSQQQPSRQHYLQQQQQSWEHQRHQLQQEREQLSQQLHHLQAGDKEMAVPSATPAEKLPGYVGSRGSDERAGGKAPERGGDSAAEGAGIPKDLLDSMAEVASMPVWKPESTHDASRSPVAKLSSTRSPDKADSARRSAQHAAEPRCLFFKSRLRSKGFRILSLTLWTKTIKTINEHLHI